MIEQRDSAELTAQSPARILYVETHPDMRRLMLGLLECAGYLCAGAASNSEALGRVTTATEKFDLIIVAHNTPGVDGLVLAQNLRARDFQGRIMLYSLELDESDEVDCEEHGVDAVLRKPTASKLLLQRVATLCSG